MCWKEYHTQEQCYEHRTEGQWHDALQPAKLSGHAQITLYPWKLNIIGLSCYAKSKDNNITTCAYTYGFKHNQSCGKSCRIYVDKHYNSHTSFLSIYSVYILTSSWRRKRWSRRRVNVDASCHGRALWCTVRPLSEPTIILIRKNGRRVWIKLWLTFGLFFWVLSAIVSGSEREPKPVCWYIRILNSYWA